MALNIKFHKKFVINGREYGSIDEVPAGLRAAVIKAMSSKDGADATPAAQTALRKITVNGVEYESVEAMPPEVKELYQGAMGIAASGTAPADGGTAATGNKARPRLPSQGVNPVRRVSDEPAFSGRTLVVLLLAAAGAALFYFFAHGTP